MEDYEDDENSSKEKLVQIFFDEDEADEIIVTYGKEDGLDSITIDLNEFFLERMLDLDHVIKVLKKRFPELTHLSLFGNEIEKIPDSISELTNLRELNLGNNNIRTLPQPFFTLSNLRILWLNNNKLFELSYEIGNLTNLRQLYLYNNKLTIIPNISELTNLIELNLANNRILVLPDKIDDYTNLNSLERSMIGDGFPNSLTNLNLNGNEFTEFPESIGNLPNLRHIFFTSNVIFTSFKKEYVLTNYFVYNYLLTKFDLELYKKIYKRKCNRANIDSKVPARLVYKAFENLPKVKREEDIRSLPKLSSASLGFNSKRFVNQITSYLGNDCDKINELVVTDVIKFYPPTPPGTPPPLSPTSPGIPSHLRGGKKTKNTKNTKKTKKTKKHSNHPIRKTKRIKYVKRFI